jgi:hypothetical protein
MERCGAAPRCNESAAGGGTGGRRALFSRGAALRRAKARTQGVRLPVKVFQTGACDDAADGAASAAASPAAAGGGGRGRRDGGRAAAARGDAARHG